MARNASGTMSLPAGNPVVSGTAVSSTWANQTLSDVAAELTNSLDRGGRGAMTAPLPLAAGSASAPALTFGVDPDTGLYRAGAADVRMQVDGVTRQQWTGAGGTLSGTLGVAGQLNVTAGVNVSNSTTNGAGAAATGNGSGAGVSGTGGASGVGVSGTGNGSSAGVSGQGGATNGNGVQGVGGGTAPGLAGFNGTAATGAARTAAIVAANGDVSLAGVTNPDSNVAVSKTLTPKNLVSAWVVISISGGVVTVLDGFNISTVTLPGSSVVRLTFAAPFASANYALSGNPIDGSFLVRANSPTASQVDLLLVSLNGTLGVLNPASDTLKFSVTLTGAQ